jgi:hypothetical protein
MLGVVLVRKYRRYGTTRGCPAPLKPDLHALKCPPADSGVYVDLERLRPNESVAEAVTAALAATHAWAASEEQREL